MTFHRAIDVSRNADEVLPALKGIAQRILNVGSGRDRVGGARED